MITSAPPAEEPPYLPGMEPDRSQQQYTYRDIAALKKVSVQTVFEWVKRGKVPSPIYTGATARFTQEHLTSILQGIAPAGTHAVAESLRAEVATAARAKKQAKKKPTAKKQAKKKQAKKKPTAKKRGAYDRQFSKATKKKAGAK